MNIVGSDFIMKPASEDSNFYNLVFMKRVKKQDTGKFAIEPGDTLYGLTLSSCISRIVRKHVAKKYADENVTLIEYLKALDKEYKEVIKFCKDEIPEKFDTGE